MHLTSEDHAKLQTKQLANIIRKLNAGKTLTAREDAILAVAQASDAADFQTPGETPASGYARTWEELADACSVDRRTLTNARTKFGKACPKDRADGRKEVAAWIRFLGEKEIRSRGVNNPDADFVNERELRLRRETFQLAKAEWEFEKAKDLMLPVAQFEAGLAVMVGNFRATTNLLPGRAAGKIVLRARAALLLMLKGALTGKQFEKVEEIVQAAPIDYADVEEILQSETDILLRTLEGCDYLKATSN